MTLKCTIARQIIRRRTRQYPPPSGVFRGARNGENGLGGRGAGEEIRRDLREKWRISLSDVIVEGGRRVRRQWPVCAITYWDVVEDRFGDGSRPPLFRHVWDRLAEIFPEAPPERIGEMKDAITMAFMPIRDEVIADYQNSEEYYWRLIQDLVRNRQRAAREESSSGEKAGNGTSSGPRNSFTGEEAGFFRQEEPTPPPRPEPPPPPRSPKTDRQMALEIIQAGYKKMAALYHPDKGGDTALMQHLNVVKDRLLRQLPGFFSD